MSSEVARCDAGVVALGLEINPAYASSGGGDGIDAGVACPASVPAPGSACLVLGQFCDYGSSTTAQCEVATGNFNGRRSRLGRRKLVGLRAADSFASERASVIRPTLVHRAAIYG